MQNEKDVFTSLTKAEQRECCELSRYVASMPEYAQKSADIWLRSAPNKKALERRREAVKALGLNGEILYL